MSVLITYATGVGAAVALAVAWIAVQSAWRRAFPERLFDADAMAGRLHCGGCDVSEHCTHRRADGSCRREEDR